MKTTPRIWIAVSFALLATAIPTISDRAMRIPLRRGSPDAASGDTMPTPRRRSLGAHRAQELVTYAYMKYKNTFATYERNTGSRHPLDTLPISKSPFKRADSRNQPLTNYGVELWYGSIAIGTQAKLFTADFDTGSADLWVPSAQCPDCFGHQSYNPDHSREPSFDVLAYGSGVVLGRAYEDTVGVAGFNISKQGFLAADLESLDFISYSFPPDGVAGLGFQAISHRSLGPPLMDSLNRSGLLSEGKFSFKLSTNSGKSEMVIGGEDRSAYNPETRVDIAVTDPGYWQVVLDGMSRSGVEVPAATNVPAIMDTGTTLIVAPCSIVDSYFASISGAQCGPCTTGSECTVPCATINQTAPTLNFGGRDFRVSNESWNLGPADNTSTNCIAGIGKADFGFVIVGDVFLQNVYLVLDFWRYSVGIAELA